MYFKKEESDRIQIMRALCTSRVYSYEYPEYRTCQWEREFLISRMAAHYTIYTVRMYRKSSSAIFLFMFQYAVILKEVHIF